MSTETDWLDACANATKELVEDIDIVPVETYSITTTKDLFTTATDVTDPLVVITPAVPSTGYTNMFIDPPPMFKWNSLPKIRVPDMEKRDYTSHCFIVESSTLENPQSVDGPWCIGVFSFKANRIVPCPTLKKPFEGTPEYYGYPDKETAIIECTLAIEPEWQGAVKGWEEL